MPKRDAHQRALKREYKRREQEKMRALMVLDEAALEDLLEFLDERAATEGCDRTLRFTAEWALQSDVPFEELKSSLGEFGGYCDCEVVANVDPETIF